MSHEKAQEAQKVKSVIGDWLNETGTKYEYECECECKRGQMVRGLTDKWGQLC